MAFRGINAHAEQVSAAPKLFPGVAELACLSGASRRLVLRIEIKNDLFPRVVDQAEKVAIPEFPSNRDSGKVRCWITSAQSTRTHKEKVCSSLQSSGNGLRPHRFISVRFSFVNCRLTACYKSFLN